MMTFGSLFSGIGGFDLGLERAGWTCRWQVEIDPWCQRVLAKHWPDVKRYGDIKEIDPHDLEPVDLVCGGFPCQPVSRAGRRMAQADDRWLWPEFARVVRGVRPRFVLVENVPGLLAHGMGDVLGELATLGFDAEWESVPAAALGAAHIRDRVWIVAHAAGSGRERVVCGAALEGDAPVGSQAVSVIGDGDHPSGQVDDASRRRHRAPNEAVFARGRSPEFSDWWAAEPDVGRVAHGIPGRVDRLRGLGNAVVPQVVEWIGRRMIEVAA